MTSKVKNNAIVNLTKEKDENAGLLRRYRSS
jgi:hypothetical protein